MNFRLWLEVTEDQLKKIKPTKGGFDNIFGNKLRIVIPLGENIWDGLLDWWQKANMQKDKSRIHSDYFVNRLAQHGYQVDLNRGIATSEIQTQQGTKKRTEKIGTVIQKLKKNAGAIKTSVIISRAPIDIVRMSDFREINSCHSPPKSKNTTDWGAGSLFRCAQQEAKTGGAVAFAVLSSDLQKVPDLQAPEIFKDRDRKIKGIEPLERLRLRRFSNGKTDVLIPEIKSYGVKHTGFIQAVLDWARKVQNNIKDLKFKKFNLHGGSYQDNSASQIWNRFFGTLESGSKKSVDEKGENAGQKWTADRLQTAAEETLAVHQKQWKHVSAWCDAEDIDGQPYLSFNGNVFFEIDDNKLAKEITEEDLSTWGWREKDPWTLGRSIKKNLDIGISEINLNDINGVITLNCNIEYESAGYGGNANRPQQLNEFESFLDELDEIEKEYTKHYNAVWKSLLEMGFVKEEQYDFNHFQLTDQQAISEDIWIGDLQGLPIDSISRKIKDYNNFNDTFVDFDKTISANPGRGPHIIFPNLPENTIFFKSEIPGYSQYGLEQQRPEFFKHPYKLYLKLIVPIQSGKIKSIEAVKEIDDHWDYYVQRAVKWWNTVKLIKQKYADKNIEFPKMPIKYPEPPKPQFKQLPLFKT